MFYYNRDDAVLGTLAARLLLARSRNYRRTRVTAWCPTQMALYLSVLGLTCLCVFQVFP